MQTGTRGSQRPAPGNTTGMTFFRQQREQEARKRAEDNPVDVAEVRKEAYAAAWEPAFTAGAEWAFGVLRDAGVDVDAVLALADDDDAGDVAEDA
jgi:hypothetical protein